MLPPPSAGLGEGKVKQTPAPQCAPQSGAPPPLVPRVPQPPGPFPQGRPVRGATSPVIYRGKGALSGKNAAEKILSRPSGMGKIYRLARSAGNF